MVRTRIVAATSALLVTLGAGFALGSPASAEVPALRIEADQFSVAPAGAGAFVAPPGSSQYLGLWASGATATTSFRFDSARAGLVVVARADACEGWPEMAVSVDGVEVGRVTVSTSYSGSYRFAGTWAVGSHRLAVKFVNDHRTPACDRNLKLHAAVFGDPVGAPTVYVNPHDFTLDPSAGSYFRWGERGTPGMVIWSNATASTEVWLQHATRIVLILGNSACQGWPRLAVRVDGALVSEFDVPNQQISTVLSGDWGEGSHLIELALVNDFRTASCDRNVKLYEMWLDAPSSA